MSSDLSRRYALAFLKQVSSDVSRVKLFLENFQLLESLLDEYPSISVFLTHPKIDFREKKLVFMQILSAIKLEKDFIASVMTLMDHGRFSLLKSVAEAFRLLFREENNILAGEIEITPNTSSEDLSYIKSLFGEKLGSDKKIDWKVTEIGSLMAGFRVRLGDTLYDASLLCQLQKLKSSSAEH
ncbi:ATP synthase F1 subunit delta [PVC group bacterium (ex Bugula neritina AB1)]|nr:ATP synthase F1 subunit delta [PVC group bacterium (ex Bugula neritina AB1)]